MNTTLPVEKTEKPVKFQEKVIELPTQEALPEETKEEKVTEAAPEETVTTEAEPQFEEAAEVVTRELRPSQSRLWRRL